MGKLKHWWGKVPAKWKKELLSIFHTFLAAVVLEIGVQWKLSNQIEFSLALVQSIAFASFRSGVKAALSQLYLIVQSFLAKRKSKD